MLNWVQSIKYNIKYGVKNIIKWFPVIWKDRDFDHGYLYDIMRFKLNNMQQFFESENTFSQDAKLYAEEIKESIILLDRIINEFVFDENWDDNKREFTEPVGDLYQLDKNEKRYFWNYICDHIDGWWD